VPLNQALRAELEFLKAYLPVQGSYRKNHHKGHEVVPRAVHQQEYVFCHEDGSKVRSIRSSITRALKDRGLVGVTPHGLRKTFCSQLARAKVHPKVAQTLMGHADVTLTMKVYTEIDDEQLKEAVNCLPRFSGPSCFI
jgi:integrase